MNLLSKILTCLFLLISCFSQAQSLEWLAPVTTNQTDEYRIHETVILANDNLLSVGLFRGTMDLDPGPGEHILQSQMQSMKYEIFTQELSASGTLVKVFHFKPGINTELLSIGVNKYGEFVVSGKFSASADLDPTDGTSMHTQTPGSNSAGQFISKMDSNGEFVWKKIISESSGINNIRAIKFDNETNFFIVNGNTTLDDVSKYSSDGDFIWGKTFGAESYIYIADVISDDKMNVYVTGHCYGLTYCFPSVQSANALNPTTFICSINDSTGNTNWLKTMGSDSGSVYATQIIAKEDLLVIAGEYGENADFSTDSNFQISYPNSGYLDGFVSLLDTSGVVKWVNTVNGVYHDSFLDIAIDSNDNIYACGYKNDSIILRKLSIEGIEKWEHAFATGHIAYENFIEVDSSFNIYAFGYSKNSIDINPSPQENTFTQGFYTRKINQITEEEPLEFLLYPNPISNSFTLFNEYYNDNVRVMIHDYSGKLVAKHEFNDYQYSVDCSGISNGSYLITIESGNKIQKELILINKE